MNKVLLTVGILCFLVPLGLQYIDKKEQKNVIETFESEMEDREADEIDVIMKKAKEYNQKLFELQSGVVESAIYDDEYDMNYATQLRMSKTGIMGELAIPKIDLKLPVYHGTGAEVLAIGIGHLEGSSLPIGGENSHAVLTGHRGLPSAELFTRLDEVEEGDEFFVQVGKQRMFYEVVETKVVVPEDVSSVKIEEGKDKVSLVTCTPYGINTHRLIVIGERSEVHDVEMKVAQLEKLGENEDEKKMWILVPIVMVGGTVAVVIRRRCK